MLIEDIKENSKSGEYDLLSQEITNGFLDYHNCLDAIRDYLKNELKEYAIYGGMAIDAILRNHSFNGIYNKDDIPDYDIYVPCEDMSKIHNTIDKLKNIEPIKSFINYITDNTDYDKSELLLKKAIHGNTFRIFIKQYTLLDISFLERKDFDMIKKFKYDDYYFTSYEYIKLGFHNSLAHPISNSYRLIKDSKRYDLIAKQFPYKFNDEKINYKEINIDELYDLLNPLKYCLVGELACNLLNNNPSIDSNNPIIEVVATKKLQEFYNFHKNKVIKLIERKEIMGIPQSILFDFKDFKLRIYDSSIKDIYYHQLEFNKKFYNIGGYHVLCLYLSQYVLNESKLYNYYIDLEKQYNSDTITNIFDDNIIGIYDLNIPFLEEKIMEVKKNINGNFITNLNLFYLYSI